MDKKLALTLNGDETNFYKQVVGLLVPSICEEIALE